MTEVQRISVKLYMMVDMGPGQVFSPFGVLVSPKMREIMVRR